MKVSIVKFLRHKAGILTRLFQISLWSSEWIPTVWDMSDNCWWHRNKNIIVLFSDVTYTVHGGDVWVVLAGPCCWASPPLHPESQEWEYDRSSLSSRKQLSLGCGEGVRGVEWKNKTPSVFQVSQLSQKCSNCCIEGHFTILTEISFKWCKNDLKMLRNVYTAAVNVQALSQILFHPCTSFYILCLYDREEGATLAALASLVFRVWVPRMSDWCLVAQAQAANWQKMQAGEATPSQRCWFAWTPKRSWRRQKWRSISKAPRDGPPALASSGARAGPAVFSQLGGREGGGQLLVDGRRLGQLEAASVNAVWRENFLEEGGKVCIVASRVPDHRDASWGHGREKSLEADAQPIGQVKGWAAARWW